MIVYLTLLCLTPKGPDAFPIDCMPVALFDTKMAAEQQIGIRCGDAQACLQRAMVLPIRLDVARIDYD